MKIYSITIHAACIYEYHFVFVAVVMSMIIAVEYSLKQSDFGAAYTLLRGIWRRKTWSNK